MQSHVPRAATAVRPGGLYVSRAPAPKRVRHSARRVVYNGSMVGAPDPHEVSRLLRSLSSGQSDAVDRLLPLVYDELRRLAQSYLRHERPGHTLQATALVNEVYLKLVERDATDWKGRAHFMAVAAQALRRVLVDYARKHKADKRGGGVPHVPIEEAFGIRIDPQGTDVLALHEVLEALAAEEPEKARVVELRFFAGLTAEETAEVMGVTVRTVERYWRYGRAWLYDALSEGS